MAKNKRHSRYSYSIGFMVIITLIMIGALALINEVTIARIERNIEIKNQEKVLEAANLLPDNATDETIQTLYQNSFESIEYNSKKLYRFSESSFVLPVSGKGLWGNITGYLGIDFSTNRILGFSIVAHSETPGLGGRIEEPDYLDQFAGLNLPAGPDYLIYRPTAGGNIDSISGATGTSNAVRNFLNENLTDYLDAYAKGEFE